MLADPRFAPSPASYASAPRRARRLPALPAHHAGAWTAPEHLRLRRAGVAPAFTPRRAAGSAPASADSSTGCSTTPHRRTADRRPPDGLRPPLPMEVICALIGVPAADRPRWHVYGKRGRRRATAQPSPPRSRRSSTARKAVLDPRRSGLVTDLAPHGARTTETEIVTLVWHLVLAGRRPPSLIAIGLHALLDRPDQLAAVPRPVSAPAPSRSCCAGAARSCWRCPRFPSEDVELARRADRSGRPR